MRKNHFFGSPSILFALHTLEERVGHQDNQILLQVHEHQDAAEHANREMSQHLAQETVVRAEADREQDRMLTTIAAQISEIEGVLTNAQTHAEQMQMEIAWRGEETEARWHRQMQERLDYLRSQITAEMQQAVASVSRQWQHRLTDLHGQYTTLQDHLMDKQQQRVHAEAHLLRLRRQRRMARRQRSPREGQPIYMQQPARGLKKAAYEDESGGIGRGLGLVHSDFLAVLMVARYAFIRGHGCSNRFLHVHRLPLCIGYVDVFGDEPKQP